MKVLKYSKLTMGNLEMFIRWIWNYTNCCESQISVILGWQYHNQQQAVFLLLMPSRNIYGFALTLFRNTWKKGLGQASMFCWWTEQPFCFILVCRDEVFDLMSKLKCSVVFLFMESVFVSDFCLCTNRDSYAIIVVDSITMKDALRWVYSLLMICDRAFGINQ